MVRVLHRLTTSFVKTAPAGLWSDGGNLVLQVTPGRDGIGLRRSWIFRYVLRGKEHQAGLGPSHTVTLAEARAAAAEWRKLLYTGRDPLHHRAAERATRALEAAKTVTFRAAAERLIASKEKGWKNQKHAAQWSATLKTYAYPVLGDLPIAAIDTGLVVKVLNPIWSSKTETASRLRGRIEAVINSAKSYGEFTGDNPAAWKGCLDAILARTSDVAVISNQPSLPYERIAEFMRDLRAREGVAAAALEFLILTVVRPGNTPRWSEIDFDAAVWVVPAMEMKGSRSKVQNHKVPLSGAALAVLNRMPRAGEFVFTSPDTGGSLSDAAMRALIKRMNASRAKAGLVPWIDKDTKRVVVPHGFRSSFRTWASDETDFPREVAEKALSHLVGDETERAYDRGSLFTKRQALMTAWSDYCHGSKAQRPAG